MVLTLGCGKFRFYDHDFGMLPNTPLPRLVRRLGWEAGQGMGTAAAAASRHLSPRVLTLSSLPWGPSLPAPQLDMGQCNDAYSAVVVASKLAEVFETDVNGLPLSLDLSWLEQKAVIILLSLLHLNVKNIRIGPKPPAFLTPEALQVCARRLAC
jgi:hydroxylamine reductase (hybrid-cluster protein)